MVTTFTVETGYKAQYPIHPTNIDNLSPNAHAHAGAVACRRVCDPLTTAKLVIRAEDFSLLHCFGPPHVIVTDKLPSYGASMKVIGNADKQKTARWLNNRAENSHQPFRRRERAMIRFRRMRTLQNARSLKKPIAALADEWRFGVSTYCPRSTPARQVPFTRVQHYR